MRECLGFIVLLLSSLAALCQTPSSNWIIIKDSKAACQIAVPPDWAPLGENNGAAIFRDPTNGIAVVTSQPGQQFKPLSAVQLKNIGVAKEKMFENSATRIFYQDKTATGPQDTNAFSSSAPGQDGTCSCHIVVLSTVPEDIAKKIALSLSPVVKPDS